MYSLLVVDDEQYAVEGVMEAIDWKSIGIMAVYGAYSSEEAKNIIRQHDIQVIVCDIEMAEESGLDFLRWMRTEGYFAKLIFLTAHARFDYAKESIWMPSMVPASACVKSTIPEAGQTGRNISAEFQRFPPFFPGNVRRNGSLPFRCRRTRSFRVQ